MNRREITAVLKEELKYPMGFKFKSNSHGIFMERKLKGSKEIIKIGYNSRYSKSFLTGTFNAYKGFDNINAVLNKYFDEDYRNYKNPLNLEYFLHTYSNINFDFFRLTPHEFIPLVTLNDLRPLIPHIQKNLDEHIFPVLDLFQNIGQVYEVIQGLKPQILRYGLYLGNGTLMELVLCSLLGHPHFDEVKTDILKRLNNGLLEFNQITGLDNPFKGLLQIYHQMLPELDEIHASNIGKHPEVHFEQTYFNYSEHYGSDMVTEYRKIDKLSWCG
ncbi:MAG: hypothetical protein H6607_05020 [Flavobacteriales bacterium]|nr:hypothetical protein [Flavobacteriales bacterium]